MRIFLLTVLVAGAMAQDTYNCPDGWDKQEDSDAVTKADATILCNAHAGAWVAEIDRPGINYWLKDKLLTTTEVGEYAQFWLGGHTEERHSEGSPGNWMWEHMNTTIDWFDWADGQPNNYHGQNCLVMREYHDPFFPWARDYFWNDYDCGYTAHYLCQNVCNAA